MNPTFSDLVDLFWPWIALLLSMQVFRMSLRPWLCTPKQTIPDLLDQKRTQDSMWAVRNPETAELRAIYREIDVAAGIGDPDLATPEESKPAPPLQTRIDEHGQTWTGRWPATKEEHSVTFDQMAAILKKQGKNLSQH